MALPSARPTPACRLTSALRVLLLLVCVTGSGGRLRAQALSFAPGPSVPHVEMWHGNNRAGPVAPGPAATTSLPPSPGLPPVYQPAPDTSSLVPLDGGRTLQPLRSVDPVLLAPPPSSAALPPLQVHPNDAVPDDHAGEKPAPAAADVWQKCGPDAVRAAASLVRETRDSLQACASWLKDVDREAPAGAVSQGTPPALLPDSIAGGSTREGLALPATRTQAGPGQAAGLSVPWHQMLLMQLPATMAALVGGPLVVALALALVLRRSGLRFRVELSGTGGEFLEGGPSRQPPAVAERPADNGAITASPAPTPAGADAGPTPDLPATAPAPVEEAAPTGEQFDLGPTYAEEKRQQEEGLRQREQAVLQEVFEQNRRLQEEIRRLDETTEDTSTPGNKASPELAADSE